jgi:ubiquinone/menaquinone biosynthesis C-methylase UbiE
MAAEDDQSDEQYKEKKANLFSGIHGRVLELGPGTGVNMAFFPANLDWVGVEPNSAMHPHLREKAEDAGISVTMCQGISSEFGVADQSFDFVVSTLVLCSVNSVAETLGEIRRALRPGGMYLFIEHVVDRRNRARRYIQTLAPYTPWRYFSDGCRPGRDIATGIDESGFSSVDCHAYMQQGKGMISWVNRPHIVGCAVK